MMATEDCHPSNRTGVSSGGNQLSGADRNFSECSGEGSTLLMETPSSASITSKSSNLTENILYMKLFHEFKQLYPKVPDETVIQCVRQVGNIRNISV